MNTKILTKILAFITAIVLTTVALTSCTVPVSSLDPNAAKYDEALELLADREFEGAYAIFTTLGDYKDTEKYLDRFYYMPVSFTYEFVDATGMLEIIYNEKYLPARDARYDDGSERGRIIDFIYDENGTIVKQIRVDGDVVSVMEYTYDEQGHNLGMTMFIDGELVSSTEYVWNNGLRTAVTTKMAAQNMTQKVLMTYDSNGLLLRQDSYSADSLSSYSLYAYDENGRVKSMTTYLPDGTLYTVSTHSWEGNTQTIVTADAQGAAMQTAVLTYDDARNLLTHSVYNALGDLVSKETHTWKAILVDSECPRASV